MKIIKYIVGVVVGLVVLDVMIVIFTLIAVASGQYVPHIPFWDAQMLFVINLLS